MTICRENIPVGITDFEKLRSLNAVGYVQEKC